MTNEVSVVVDISQHDGHLSTDVRIMGDVPKRGALKEFVPLVFETVANCIEGLAMDARGHGVGIRLLERRLIWRLDIPAKHGEWPNNPSLLAMGHEKNYVISKIIAMGEDEGKLLLWAPKHIDDRQVVDENFEPVIESLGVFDSIFDAVAAAEEEHQKSISKEK